MIRVRVRVSVMVRLGLGLAPQRTETGLGQARGTSALSYEHYQPPEWDGLEVG